VQDLSPKNNYREIYDSIESIESEVRILDHLGGFDESLRNPVLDRLNSYAVLNNRRYNVIISYPFLNDLTDLYSNLDIRWHIPAYMFRGFKDYHNPPPVDFKNFICTFNGFGHVSRKLLVSALHRYGLWNPDYCSKNFAFSQESLDGAILEITGAHERFYNKFFMSEAGDKFYESIYSFEYDGRCYHHNNNIYILENKLSNSFLHLVSETMATSYYPFVTEKFLYSVVTKGLFIAYGQPGWHEHLRRCFGFKKFYQIFDYRFDRIQNPIERLIELITMLSKFRHLSWQDLHDLYLLEKDTIEFNYDHYYSSDFLKVLTPNGIYRYAGPEGLDMLADTLDN
jgi:hypothetical protein